MHVAILSQPRKSSFRILSLLFFALAGLVGLGILVYLLVLPIDPDTKTALLYPLTRLVLIGATIAGIFLFAILFWECVRDLRWQQRFEWFVTHRSTTIPSLVLGILLAIFLVLGAIALYQPDWILTLNKDKLDRLLPFLAWLAFLMLQLIVIWFKTWVIIEIRIAPRTWDAVAMIILFVVSFSARANMTGYGLPYQNVWDEVVTYPQAMRMLVEPGLKPYSDVPGYGKAAYGDFLTYITAGGEVVGFLNGMRTQVVDSVVEYVSPPAGVTSINSAVHPSGIPLQVPRLLLSLINSLTPVLIYWILRKSFGIDAWSSYGAGFILAFFSREVIYYSSYILPDALATTLFTGLLLAAFACLNDERGKLGPYLASGLLTGLVLSVTVRAVAVILVPFLVLLLARNHSRLWAKFGIILSGVVVAFVISSPYALLDFPGYLNKITGLTWYQDLSWSHRLSGLVFYFQGLFQPGFNSGYVDSNTGSIGLGPNVAFLVLVGSAKLVRQYPRHTFVMLIFAVVHLYMISAIVQRFTRHALVLYPIVCVFAGAGLVVLAQGLVALLKKVSTRAFADTRPSIKNGYWWQKGAPAFLLILFLLVSLPQMNLTLHYIQRTHNYQTTQERVTGYLSAHLKPGDKVGILDVLPWVEQDLIDRDISFERFTVKDSPETLRDKGITYVVSTDRFMESYNGFNGTSLTDSFSSPGAKLVEFNTSPLQYEGYPAGNLYMFVARVP